MSTDLASEIETTKRNRHNFVVNVLDGTNFWLGYSFMSSGVILPLYISHYTNSPLLIGLIAVISTVGYYFPQLFTANLVERLPVKKVLPVNVGLFTERLPILLLAPTALLFAGNARLALASLYLLFAWHTFGAGILAVAWNDMIGKIIPLAWRGRFMGVTGFGGQATGVVGASIAAWLLDRYAFPTGYVVCFTIGAVFVLISWFFLAQTRELPSPVKNKVISHREYWSKLPGVLRQDPNFSRFILSMAVVNLGGLAWGFLAVYAKQHWHMQDGDVGTFNITLLIGQGLSNIVFGWIADRRGYKLVIELAATMAALSVALAIFAPNPAWFHLVFGLRGISLGGLFMGTMIAMEFGPEQIRPTYIGLNNTSSGAINGIAPALGGWLAGWLGYHGMFQAAMVLAVLGLILLHFLVKEPRNEKIKLERKIAV